MRALCKADDTKSNTAARIVWMQVFNVLASTEQAVIKTGWLRSDVNISF